MVAELHTAGELARLFGVKKHVLDYAITRAGVQEIGRAGLTRLFTREQAEVIARSVTETRLTRKGRGKP